MLLRVGELEIVNEAEENKIEGDNEDDNNDGEQLDAAKLSKVDFKGHNASENADEPNCFATI